MPSLSNEAREALELRPVGEVDNTNTNSINFNNVDFDEVAKNVLRRERIKIDLQRIRVYGVLQILFSTGPILFFEMLARHRDGYPLFDFNKVVMISFSYNKSLTDIITFGALFSVSCACN